MYTINLELRTKQREKRDVSFGGIVLRDGYHHHIIIIIPVHSLENRTQHNQTTNNTKKYEVYIYNLCMYM